MPVYAQINENSICVGVSELSSHISMVELIEIDKYDESLIGKRYDAGEWVVVPLPQTWLITQLAFLNRFTDEEAISIDLASIGATVEAATIRRYMSKISAASFIDLKSPNISQGVAAMETVNLIDAGRASEIVDTPARADEI